MKTYNFRYFVMAWVGWMVGWLDGWIERPLKVYFTFKWRASIGVYLPFLHHHTFLCALKSLSTFDM